MHGLLKSEIVSLNSCIYQNIRVVLTRFTEYVVRILLYKYHKFGDLISDSSKDT